MSAIVARSCYLLCDVCQVGSSVLMVLKKTEKMGPRCKIEWFRHQDNDLVRTWSHRAQFSEKIGERSSCGIIKGVPVYANENTLYLFSAQDGVIFKTIAIRVCALADSFWLGVQENGTSFALVKGDRLGNISVLSSEKIKTGDGSFFVCQEEKIACLSENKEILLFDPEREGPWRRGYQGEVEAMTFFGDQYLMFVEYRDSKRVCTCWNFSCDTAGNVNLQLPEDRVTVLACNRGIYSGIYIGRASGGLSTLFCHAYCYKNFLKNEEGGLTQEPLLPEEHTYTFLEKGASHHHKNGVTSICVGKEEIATSCLYEGKRQTALWPMPFQRDPLQNPKIFRCVSQIPYVISCDRGWLFPQENVLNCVLQEHVVEMAHDEPSDQQLEENEWELVEKGEAVAPPSSDRPLLRKYIGPLSKLRVRRVFGLF